MRHVRVIYFKNLEGNAIIQFRRGIMDIMHGNVSEGVFLRSLYLPEFRKASQAFVIRFAFIHG